MNVPPLAGTMCSIKDGHNQGLCRALPATNWLRTSKKWTVLSTNSLWPSSRLHVQGKSHTSPCKELFKFNTQEQLSGTLRRRTSTTQSASRDLPTTLHKGGVEAPFHSACSPLTVNTQVLDVVNTCMLYAQTQHNPHDTKPTHRSPLPGPAPMLQCSSYQVYITNQQPLMRVSLYSAGKR